VSEVRRILVIEDDFDVGVVLKHTLERGFQASVDVAVDGRQGLDRARSERYDLIVCDLMLPLLDGLEVVRRLQQEEPLVETPVIFLTAATSVFKYRSAQSWGAIGYLGKPVDLRGVCDTMRAMLAEASRGHHGA
jgi:two-component system alkaline phosphatase synthesis response regulator PhoP